jgi:Uma2 family endonuclease
MMGAMKSIVDESLETIAMVLATDRRMTLKEYLAYDDGTEMQYELVDGVLVEMGNESTLNTRIATMLMFAFAALGIPHYRLSTKDLIEVRGNAASSRYPDLVVHSEESFTAIDGRSEACIELADPAPMLLIEVVSPGAESSKNYQRDYEEKPIEYANRGIPEFWLIDPDRFWVKVLTLQGDFYQIYQYVGNEIIVSPTFPLLNLTAAQVLTAGR